MEDGDDSDILGSEGDADEFESELGRSMLVRDDQRQPEPVDRFASTVKELRPGYKSGLATQMFIENQVAAVAAGVVQNAQGNGSAPASPQLKFGKDIQHFDIEKQLK